MLLERPKSYGTVDLQRVKHSRMTQWVMNDEAVLPIVLGQISLGRAGHPREIGTVAAFFASDDASYLRGQSIFVDGGWAGKEARRP